METDRKALNRLETILKKMESWQHDFSELDPGCYMANSKSELIRYLLPRIEERIIGKC